jgi:hypothetical protein
MNHQRIRIFRLFCLACIISLTSYATAEEGGIMISRLPDNGTDTVIFNVSVKDFPKTG